MNAEPAIDPVLQAALAEYGQRLRDPWWRLTGMDRDSSYTASPGSKLYKITDEDGFVIPFAPNEEQLDLLAGFWHRNVIPKARQLGFSTLIELILTDHAQWVPNQRCGVVSYDLESAGKIFRTKVLFAWENQPAWVKEALPLKSQSADELRWQNGSSIQVALSMRSGTIQMLHVSELAKMGKKFPLRAKEVMSGSLNAVPASGVVFIESTSEGPEGEFAEVAKAAEDKHKSGAPLSRLDFKLFFYPWWKKRAYRLDPRYVRITANDHVYFNGIEHEEGCTIEPEQRAWYVAKRNAEYRGDVETMWREYPSTLKECWNRSTEGTWYANELALARAEGRIRKLPKILQEPVHTFWDIGNSDGTAIWLMQHVHPEYRFIGYIEEWEHQYNYFVKTLQEMPYIWGTHYLPHDAEHERQGEFKPYQPLDVLRKLAPRWKFEIVPRVAELQHGIQAVRDVFGQCWFDVDDCAAGIEHLQLYKKRFVPTTQTYADEPVKHDGHSEAADAFRQFAQAFPGFNPTVRTGQRPRRSAARRRAS